MAKLKTRFELVSAGNYPTEATIGIIGEAPKDAPYLVISHNRRSPMRFVKNKDLERLAVNILKALKSKRLKS